jgi:hypothetical protein
MLTTKYNKTNHTKDDDIEMVCMEDVMKTCKTVVGKHGEEDNTDLRVLKKQGVRERIGFSDSGYGPVNKKLIPSVP